jgi:hypothetical protein
MAAVSRLRAECRAAKEALSVDTDVTIPVILPTVQTEVRLTRSEFEEMVGPRIGTTIAALRRAARSADLELSDVDKILLVGGSSRIPLVRQRVREETDSQVFLDAHPKHAIALGAAIAADLGLGTPAFVTVSRAAAATPLPPSVKVVEPSPLPADPLKAREAAVPLDAPVETSPPAEPPIEEQPVEREPVTDPLLDLVTPSEPETAEIEMSPEAQAEGAAPHTVDRADAKISPPPPVRTGPVAGEAVVEPDVASIASAQWQDGISLSPVLIGALLAVALGSAAGMFLVLSLLVG